MDTTIYKPYGMRHGAQALVFDDGMTKQNHQDECDINHILKKFQKTGVLEHAAKHTAEYQEYSSLDLHTALNVTTRANSMFEELPSHIRSKFKNDPGTFLDYVQDPKNNKEAAELGLVERVPEPTPQKTNIKATANKAPAASTGEIKSDASASESTKTNSET